MAIWMDMTYSMRVWKGGLIGIVRAELEMAKNLHAIDDAIRYCVAGNDGFKELHPEELEWLFNADNVGDAYLDKMGRHSSNVKEDVMDDGIPYGLKLAHAYSENRSKKIIKVLYMLISRVPLVIKPIVWVVCIIPTLILALAMRALEAVKEYKKRKKGSIITDYRVDDSVYPFKDGDSLFSSGWYSGYKKESALSKIKRTLPNLKIAYLIYDLVIVNPDTAALYDEERLFGEYLNWIANNCDYVFYGGKTAQEDAEEYFKKKGLGIKPGYVLRFGSNVSNTCAKITVDEVLSKYELEEKYILAVGSVDAKKNYTTIYNAYTMMHDADLDSKTPQLVIVGGVFADSIFLDEITHDPRINKRIVIIRPTDEELEVLYKNCLFTILPTWYEGWSLTLPESLNYGKLCLASDVRPLREIGQELVVYINPEDASGWAKQIIYFTEHPEEVLKREEIIRLRWVNHTWDECGETLLKGLKDMDDQVIVDSHIFYDVSLIYLLMNHKAPVSGILRTELLFARHLGHIFPHMQFIALTDNGYKLFDRETLAPLFEEGPIDKAFQKVRLASQLSEYKMNKDIVITDDNMEDTQNLIEKREKKRATKSTNGEIFWMATSILPWRIQKSIADKYNAKNDKAQTEAQDLAYDLPLKSNDVLFSVGVGFNTNAYASLKKAKADIGFKYIQLIYDFTPILYPQVHTRETRTNYKPFLEKTYDIADCVFYGGETAMRDGIEYAKDHNLPNKPGYVVRFGCDIMHEDITERKAELQKKELFEKLGLGDKYILAVGSIELRKNYETLYRAYTTLMKEHTDLPQLVICGYPGWKTENLVEQMGRDKRISDKIILISPKDEELDILYKNCMFTLLASLYEGWSLTLPESLNYGKLCIASDVAPLREIGGDMIDYVKPFDVNGWAEKMYLYYTDKEKLKEKTEMIVKAWSPITWEACCKKVASELLIIQEQEA